jgi:hypothetical protein
MHLTNYAIQKKSENFEFNEDQDNDACGHKRSLTAVLDHIRQNEPNVNADELWTKIIRHNCEDDNFSATESSAHLQVLPARRLGEFIELRSLGF